MSFKHIAFNVKRQYPFAPARTISLIAAGTGIAPVYQARRRLPLPLLLPLHPTPTPTPYPYPYTLPLPLPLPYPYPQPYPYPETLPLAHLPGAATPHERAG